MITADPAKIAIGLSYRNRKTLHKIAMFPYKRAPMIKRSKVYVRLWKVNNKWYEDRLTVAALSPLFERGLMTPDKHNIMRLTPLGELVRRYLTGQERRHRAPDPIFQQDESGQYNMNL